jgi:hypothetical protein
MAFKCVWGFAYYFLKNVRKESTRSFKLLQIFRGGYLNSETHCLPVSSFRNLLLRSNELVSLEEPGKSNPCKYRKKVMNERQSEWKL